MNLIKSNEVYHKSVSNNIISWIIYNTSLKDV